MKDCIYQKPAKSPGMILCESIRVSPEGISLQESQACNSCPFRNLPEPNGKDRPRVPIFLEDDSLIQEDEDHFQVDGPCQYRGEKIRDDECNLCGIKGQSFGVLECSLYGECSLRPAHSNLRNCLGCMVRRQNTEEAADTIRKSDSMTNQVSNGSF